MHLKEKIKICLLLAVLVLSRGGMQILSCGLCVWFHGQGCSGPPVWELRVFSHWTSGEVPKGIFWARKNLLTGYSALSGTYKTVVSHKG